MSAMRGKDTKMENDRGCFSAEWVGKISLIPSCWNREEECNGGEEWVIWLSGKAVFLINALSGAFLVSRTVKNLPTMLETLVQSVGQEDPLQKGMATHSSILAWRIPWTEKPGRLQSIGLQRVGHDWAHMRSDMQFASSKNSLDEEFNFFNREYAIHIFYIVLSVCESCIFQEISLLPNLWNWLMEKHF